MEDLQELKLLLTKLKEMRRRVSKELSRAPEGMLLVVNDRGYSVYRQVRTENGRRVQKSIGKSQVLIDALAHKRFLMEKLKRLDRNIGLIEGIYGASISLEDGDIFAVMPKSFAALDRAAVILGHGSRRKDWPCPVRDGVYPEEARLDIEPERRFEWACSPYAENTSFLEMKKYLSAKGVLCRSKSEAAILGIYDSLGIPYHYDEVLYLNGALRSPDIIGCRADGAFVFHEHLGLSSGDYLQKNNARLKIYGNAGIFPGKNLILTYDRQDGTIDLGLIKAVIEDAYRL